MPPRLETERLILRPYTEDDLEIAYQVFEGHPDVWRFDPGHARTREQRAAIVHRLIQINEEAGEGTLAVTLRESGRFIGQAGLQLYILPWEPFATPEVELYYKLDRAFWGHGYATEACRALVNFAFEQMRLARLVTVTQPENQRSIRLLCRLGMTIAPAPDKWKQEVIGVLLNPRLSQG